jgi:hypothetical protein
MYLYTQDREIENVLDVTMSRSRYPIHSGTLGLRNLSQKRLSRAITLFSHLTKEDWKTHEEEEEEE